MAVLVEGISVIIKAESVTEKFPGGWKAFEANPPNKTLCADGELIRIGFMVPDDVKRYIGTLAEYDIQYLVNGKAEDLIVADQQRGFAAPCDWAEFGRIPLDLNNTKIIAACRKTGSTVNQVVMPDGWNFEESLSSRFLFVPDGNEMSYAAEPGHPDDGVDVYTDPDSGKKLYQGRVKD